MNLVFKNIQEFEGYFGESRIFELNKIKCDCGNYYEMYLGRYVISIGDCTITVNDCPIMKCSKCGKEHLCPSMPKVFYRYYHEMVKYGETECRLTSKNEERFDYCMDSGLIYDARDLSIPGLGIDLDPTNPKGFSCPVFFDRKVLNIFYSDDDYELDFACESHGTIAKRGDDYFYEWKIDFGINQNDKVVLFLGDLQYLEPSDKAMLFLKPTMLNRITVSLEQSYIDHR